MRSAGRKHGRGKNLKGVRKVSQAKADAAAKAQAKADETPKPFSFVRTAREARRKKDDDKTGEPV